MLIHGPAGSGKTTLAATALLEPSYRPVLLLSFENSITPIRDVCTLVEEGNFSHKPDQEMISVMNISTWQTCVDLWGTQRGVEFLSQFTTIIIDSLTNANDRVVDYMVNREGVKPGDIKTPDLRDWNRSYNVIKDLVWTLQEDPKRSYILICHSKESLGDSRKYPSLQGDKLGAAVTGIVDHVAYMDVDTTGKIAVSFNLSLRAFAKKRRGSKFDLKTGRLIIDDKPLTLNGAVTVPQIVTALGLD